MDSDIDFRVIPPIKKYSKFYDEEIFEVPCRVLSIGDNIRGKLYNIDIELLHFWKGKMVKSPGKTFAGTLEIMKSLDVTPPFLTNCVVRKLKGGFMEFNVYGLFNAGLVEDIYDVEGILDNDENEIMDLFNHNYKELREWLRKPDEEIDELP